jgi:sugar lactone lactonase YvrE
MHRFKWSFVGVASAALLAAAVGRAGHAAANPGSPPVTTVVALDPAAGELPESITSDGHGNLYFSLVSGSVRRINPDHSVVQIATVPLPAGASLTGIKVGPDGFIYACSDSFSPTPDGAFVWRISPATGAVTQFASLDANGFPNDLAFTDDGTLFVTDPFLGVLWKIDGAGHATVFLSDPLLAGNPAAPAFAVHPFGVDGIAFAKGGHELVVSNVDFGRVMRIDLDDEAPRVRVLVEDLRLQGVDGIAIDRRGTIYAAVNTQNRIATVDKHGRIEILAEGSPPFDSPASFAFGTAGNDKKTLYVANFAIVNVLGGQPAHPGIVSLPVQTPGLPLIGDEIDDD